MKGKQEGLAPIGGPVWTPVFKILAVVALSGVVISLWRFWVGIGPASGLTDAYPWGSWKILNVIVLTALGSGGYAMALLVYVLNKGMYHPLVRTSILTSAVGYTTGVIALVVDIGRPWNMVNMLRPWEWNLHSVLLEIAVCVTAYLLFLWIEMAEPVLEEWADTGDSRLKVLARKVGPVIDRYFPWIVATAVLLPTLHQSSLGSLFLLAGPRLHPLWQTPFLPLLFLLSCYAMGYAAVVIATNLSALAWKTSLQAKMVSALSRVMGWVLVAFLLIRWTDVVYRGALGSATEGGLYATLFFLESVLLGLPAIGLLTPSVREQPGAVFRLAMLIVLGGGLYRLDAALIGFMPGGSFSYFPSVLELLITLGFVAMALMGYLYFVKRFPILSSPTAGSGGPAPPSSRGA